MKKIKLFVRTYKTQDGREFTKIVSNGKYLPILDAKEDVYYQVKFTAKSTAKEPTKEGVYIAGLNSSKDCWIDQRDKYTKRNIVRMNVVKVIYDEPLPTKYDENELE